VSEPAKIEQRIEPDDIESKFRELQGDVAATADAAKGTVIAVGAGVAVLLLLLVFLLGRSRGKKKSTIVEVRRF
jgi:hypothetical protein